MRQYLDLMRFVLEEGDESGDRTGTGTKKIFSHQMRFDLTKGFPLLTTKKLHLKSIIYELLWMLKGETNIQYLKDHGVTIWDKWADDDGELGPVYGSQWRSWRGADDTNVDQIAWVVDEIKRNPNSRRLLVSAWNAAEIDKMALPPCPTLFQFWVSEGALSCHLTQRSGDIFLGVPFNIASYSLLTIMMAQVTGLEPYEFTHTIVDAHLYKNHLGQAQIQLEREPRTLPTIELNSDVDSIDGFGYDDFTLHGYDPHPHIKAEVSV